MSSASASSAKAQPSSVLPLRPSRNVGSNNNSTEFASPLSQTTSRPVHTHLPSLSLPVNPLPFSVREFNEHDPYAPTRTNTSTSNHSHVSGSSKHKRNGSRAVVATIRESELPPLPQSTMLAPRDGHAVHQRRAGAAGAGKTQGVLGRAAAVVADMYLRRAQGIYRHPHFLPGIPPLRQTLLRCKWPSSFGSKIAHRRASKASVPQYR